jgi:Ser-tRNA(Ala) deacylase AlaX
MKIPYSRPIRSSLKPDWYDAIEDKLTKHISWLRNKYHIQSHTVEDVFNEVVSKMVNVEQNGSRVSARKKMT